MTSASWRPEGLCGTGRAWRRWESPCSGIDTDVRWGRSATSGWVFGYKLHLVSTTLPIAVPLSANITTANVANNRTYPRLIEGFLGDVGFTVGMEGTTIRTSTP
ncbi:MAG: hypothetical protein ACE5Z5_04285 [Candidatus Bathyarchaeia archaeon]